MSESFELAKEYGFDVPIHPNFDFAMLKTKRDAYIKRLNGIYERNLQKDNVELIRGHGIRHT